jgi:hypothetical protein
MNRRAKLHGCAIGFILLAVLLVWLFDHRLATFLAEQFGSALERIGDGKFPNKQLFVLHRIHEALALLLWTYATIVLTNGMFHLLRHRSGITGTALCATTVFAAINLWILLASRCALFWFLFWQGDFTRNLVAFEIKRILYSENQAAHRMVIVGSSQANRQINERMLNQRFKGQAWTSELHFPGSTAFDVWTTWSNLAGNEPDTLIYYLSERDFVGSNGLMPAYFFNVSRAADWKRFTDGKHGWSAEMRFGLLARCLPLFRIRDALSSRILGAAHNRLDELQHDTAQNSNLEARATLAKSRFTRDEFDASQRTALRALARSCEERGTRLILLFGHLNPVLEQQLGPAYREELRPFLKALHAEFSKTTVVFREQMPLQVAGDYTDLTHVDDATQARFTEWLGNWLEKQGQTPAIPSNQ